PGRAGGEDRRAGELVLGQPVGPQRRDLVLAGQWGGGDPGGAVAGGGEGEDLVLLGELRVAGSGLVARGERRVAVDELQLPAVDAAGGVDVVEHGLHRLEERDAELADGPALD